MTEPIRLRAWQSEALGKLEARVHASFLAVATPGAGKTTFALAAVHRALVARQMGRCIVVVPTQHLKLQWALAGEAFGIHLDPEWTAADGALPSDVHGVAVTYQQVAANPEALRRFSGQAFVVLDEIHHAADARSWGDGIRIAFERAPIRLCLSGTPFRSDQNSIPFVRYVGEEAQADYEYGYGEALVDRQVVRPVFFPRINGRMEWTSPDGVSRSASFDDVIGRTLGSQRLRTALDLKGDWLPAVLTKAHHQLRYLRQRDPRAGGLVIAIDQDHARGIAKILQERLGVRATVATSDDPAASRKIAEFREGQSEWIVAVRMVSEGVDIPRLRVGVYATNTSTDLFFRQAVGRLVRVSGRAVQQRAYMFIPDDPRLRHFAFGIAEQRRHSLRKPEAKDDEFETAEAEAPEDEPATDGEDQLSLFSAIAAVPLDEKGRPLEPGEVIEEPPGEAHGESGEGVGGEGGEGREGDGEAGARPAEGEDGEHGEAIPGLVGEGDLDLGDAAPAFALTSPDLALDLPAPEAAPDEPTALSPRTRKRKLREQNSARVRALVHRSRLTHAKVNAELNRMAGIRRITEATVPQLEKRLEAADRWLRRLR